MKRLRQPALKITLLAEIDRIGIGEAQRRYGINPTMVDQWKYTEKSPGSKVYERFFEYFCRYNEELRQPEFIEERLEEDQGLPEDLSPVFGSELTTDNTKVVILSPVYREMTLPTYMSLFALKGMDPEKVTHRIVSGDGMVSRSRNWLATNFLTETDTEWSMWVDHDMVLPCGNANFFRGATGFDIPDDIASMNILRRLITPYRTGDKSKTLISGVYYIRDGSDRPVCSPGLERTEESKQFASDLKRFLWKKPELIKINWAGTGVLIVHRSVYTDILEQFPEVVKSDNLKVSPHTFFSPADITVEGKGGKITLNRDMGEDQFFGLLARAAGHTTWLDPISVCGHVGSKTYGPAY